MRHDSLTTHRKAVYRAHQTTEDAHATLADFARETCRTLRAYVVLSKLGMADFVHELEHCGDDITVTHADVSAVGSTASLSLRRSWGMVYENSVEGETVVLSCQQPGVYWLLSDYDAAFWTDGVGVCISRLYPRVIQPAMSTAEIEGLLQCTATEERAGPENFRIVKLNYQVRIDDPHARRRKATESSWTDLSLDLAFEQAREQDAHVTRVGFQIIALPTQLTEGHIGWRGDLSYRGDYVTFRRLLIGGVASLASTMFSKLDDRERSAGTEYETHPFFIEFESDILAETSSRKRLVAALRRMPNTSQSVIHDNPYVHVAMLDGIEGTACDVYVLSSARICIVPQTRSSPSSLSRLYAHITHEFGEGRLLDYAEVY